MSFPIDIILIFVSLVFAVITAASETSITAVSRVKLRRLAVSGSRAAKIILGILETPEKFFGTILVANNIVDVLVASLLTAIMIDLFKNEQHGIIAATVLATAAIIVSEVTAKTLAAKHSEKISCALARPTEFLVWFLSPVVNVLARLINFIIRVLGVGSASKPSLVTEEEIRALIKIGEEEGAIGKEKGIMLSKIFDFGHTLVNAVMTPKLSIVALDVESKYEDIMRTVLESAYSRLPVYRDSPENIIGIINVKDLLNFWEHKELIILQDMLYPPTFVSASRKVSDLLKEFQMGHAHIAVVVDARGKVEGVVTLEDLLEEIVGDIADEYDIRKPEMEKMADDRYIVSGRCRLKRLNRELDINLPEKEFITVGSFIRRTLKRVPEKGEEFEFSGWKFIMKKVEGSRIIELEAEKKASPGPKGTA